jgi:hypothetical protein
MGGLWPPILFVSPIIYDRLKTQCANQKIDTYLTLSGYLQKLKGQVSHKGFLDLQ